MSDLMLSKILPPGLSKNIPAPAFELPDQEGKIHRLSDYRGKWVVLYFYPKDETFGCTREACSFQAAQTNFSSLNAVILGVSVDTVESHKAFAQNHSIQFPLLSDSERKVVRDYGLLMPLGIANRVTYLINPEGIIVDKLSWVNWFNYGPQVANRLRELQG